MDVGLGLEGGVESLEEGVDVARPAAGEVGHDAQDFFFKKIAGALFFIISRKQEEQKQKQEPKSQQKKQTTSAGYQKRQHGRN